MKKFALLMVSLLVVSSGAIAGNIPAIAANYSQINETMIELLTTLPSLFIIFTVWLSPSIAKRIGYKVTVQVGVVSVLVAGILPVITTSFFWLFLSRIVFGIGVGLFNPLLYSFAVSLYRDQELASVIGLQSAFEGIGGMLITFLVGQLLVFGWRISFVAYLVSIPILLIFSWYVPEIQVSTTDVREKQGKQRMSLSFIGYLALLFITVTVYMSVTVKITTLLIARGMGGATGGSNLIALVGLGAMLAGMGFGRLFLIFKQHTLWLSFSWLAIAMFLFAFSNQFWVFVLAAILCGFGFRTFIPYIFNEINQQAENNEKNTALLLIVFNLGAAFSPISIAIVQSWIPSLIGTGLFIGEGALMVGVAIVMGLIGMKQKNRLNTVSLVDEEN